MGTRSIIKVITISVYFCWNFQSTKFSIYFIVWNPSSAYTWKGKQRRLRWGRNLNFKSDLQNVKIDKRQICFKTNLAGSTLYTDDSKLKIHKKKRSALYTCVLFAYMEKTSDVAETAFLATKYWRKIWPKNGLKWPKMA